MKTTFQAKSLLYSFVGLGLGAIAASIALSFLYRPTIQASAPNPAIATPPMKAIMGDADQHFIIMMIPHHQDAIDMAELALTRSQRTEIQTLAKAIRQTQSQEIEQMQEWYKQWYGTEVPNWTPGMNWSRGRHHRWTMDMRHDWNDRFDRDSRPQGRMGMMSTDLTALENAPDFDREFLLQMIPHHQMAVMMSTRLMERSTHSELQDLAASIAKSQSQEIEQMQQWYEDWYGQAQKP